MRRILITDKVKGYAEEYASNLFSLNNSYRPKTVSLFYINRTVG